MPHITVEYSKNLEKSIDILQLIRVVHDAIIATDSFTISNIRTRGVPCSDYYIADGNPDNAFLAIVGRIAPGRPQQVRHDLGNAIYSKIKSHLNDTFNSIPLSLTVELQEIDQTAAFKHSTIVARP
jgi:5-carboxymethyl-2-hydroxymuconate isomerase